MEELILDKSHTVYLKLEGEICNRLKQGIRVKIDKRKGDWAHITWLSGKKNGWIRQPSSLTLLS